jgi:hypothetical protein
MAAQPSNSFYDYSETSTIETGFTRGRLFLPKRKAIILNPITVITQVDASGMGLGGWGVKTGARSGTGPGSST